MLDSLAWFACCGYRHGNELYADTGTFNGDTRLCRDHGDSVGKPEGGVGRRRAQPGRGTAVPRGAGRHSTVKFQLTEL